MVISHQRGRDRSVRLIREANKLEALIGVVSQKEDDTEVPGPEDLNKVGTVARILKMLKMPDGTNTVILQGQQRFKWTKSSKKNLPQSQVEGYGGIDEPLPEKEGQAMMESLRDLSVELIEMNPNIPTKPPRPSRASTGWAFWSISLGATCRLRSRTNKAFSRRST